ncbi:MAG TPA: hypothetical protein VMR34_01485 [Candidatus Saccharimonadales bacterium]|nr:hypothetical protein [Candidatus Saccharimonadales bacterium]
MKDKVEKNRLFAIYVASLLIFIALGVVAILWSGRADFQITSSYLTSNDLASQTTTVFAPASRVLWAIQYRQVLIVMIVLALFLPVSFIRYKLNPGLSILAENYRKWRSADKAICSAIAVFLAAELTGLQDFFSLIVVVLSVLGIYGLVYLAESRAQSEPGLSLFAQTIVRWFFVLPYLAIILVAGGTWFFGMIRSPWYVYVLDVLALVYVSLGICTVEHRPAKKIGPINIKAGTVGFTLIDQLVKATFIFILIFAIHKQ